MNIIESYDTEKIYYEEAGSGEISLVFIHGAGADIRVWKHQRAFSSEFRCIFVDLPGHGKSGKNRENYTMESYGKDIQAVINQLNLQNVILVGWSMGGCVMLEAAKMLPKKIIGLLGLDTLFPLPFAILPEGTNSIYTHNNEEQSNKILALFGDDLVEAGVQMMPMFLSEKFDPADQEIAMSISRDAYAPSLKSEWIYLLKWDYRDRVHEISQPIRLIICEETSGSETEVKEAYAKHFKNTIFLKELKHWFMLEDPKTANWVMEEQIQSIIDNQN